VTEYFTTCKSEDEATVRRYLEKEKKHTYIETLKNNVELATYADKEWKFCADISGTGKDVIIHTRK